MPIESIVVFVCLGRLHVDKDVESLLCAFQQVCAKSTMKVAVVLGTRPEAIKLAPVHAALVSRAIHVDLISSGQHREMLQTILQTFGLEVQVDLAVMRPNQSLPDLTAALVASLGATIANGAYDAVLVQGDTTTAMAAALAGFYARIPVCHVEAGLRTHNIYSPFPEEVNRRLVSAMATKHYAPTQRARANLLAEGIDSACVVVTGNTVIDALRWVAENRAAEMAAAPRRLGLLGKPFVLMTTHRRENIGEPMRAIFHAMRDFLGAHSDVQLVLPMHRNPSVRAIVLEMLEHTPNAVLIEAQEYMAFCGLMAASLFIVTDSGGIQEEAPFLNKRTLVIRDATERPEAIEAGTAILVGTGYESLRSAMEAAHLEAVQGRVPNLRIANPFGDGHAAERVADDLGGL